MTLLKDSTENRHTLFGSQKSRATVGEKLPGVEIGSILAVIN